MGYTVGVSSGFWNIRKDPALLGLAQKVGGFGATAGVQFNQIDLETPAEFYEPRVRENIKRTQRELNIKVGLHAEIGGMSALESAERRIWQQAHIRLVETVKFAAETNIVYVNFHTSSTPQLQFEEPRLRPFGHQYEVVAPDGKTLASFCKKSKNAKATAMELIKESYGYSIDDKVKQRVFTQKLKEAPKLAEQDLEDYKKSGEFVNEVNQINAQARAARLDEKNAETFINTHLGVLLERKKKEFESMRREEVNRKVSRGDLEDDEIIEMWGASDFGRYFIQTGEIGAYLVVAHHMKSSGDAMWSNIVGSTDPDDAYHEKPKEFNAAVTSAYLEGHLRLTDHEWNKKYLNGMSVLDFARSNGVYLCFELPEVEGGAEGTREALYRFYDPLEIQHFIRKMNSPYVRMCIDFEHMLANKLNPSEMIKKAPGDFGSLVYLFHLGEPKPYYGKAHIPIPVSSQAQEVLYKWLYDLRKKGFKDGILIFERGGGRRGSGQWPGEVLENSVWVLQQFKKYLEQGVAPNDLPAEFYGLSVANKEFYPRQVVTMKEHAWDPLEGVLAIPEEKHTYMSRTAVEKGKAKEWEARKFR